MSLRSRTALILLVSLVLVMGILYAVLNHYIFAAFARLERVHFNKLGTQVARTVEGRQHYFDSFVRDWAIWTSSYQFIEDQNSEFIEDNIAIETLEGIGTLCFVYFDREFNVIYRFSTQDDYPLVSNIIRDVQSYKTLFEQTDLMSNPSFFLCIKDSKNPFLAALHPVIPTDHSLASNGYLLMGTLVDDEFLTQVSYQTGYDFDLVKVCGQPCINGKTISRGKIDVRTNFLNDKYSEMELTVHDIQDDCSFKFVTTVEREMNIHLTHVFRVTFVVMMLLGLFGILVVEMILNRLVIAPVSSQIRHFNQINDSGDLTQRIEERGRGELLLLAQTSNRMLEKIDYLNRELHQASETDSLTGLWNRRRFDKQLSHEWHVALRNGQAVSMLMIDVDHFKIYNDSYGHQEGDSCLQRVADAISSNLLRAADMATRYGGEEFAVILPDIDNGGALKVAQRIRETIESLQIANRDAPTAKIVTVSIGVATLSPNKASDQDDLVRMADQALYRAKELGRNRCLSSVDIS